MTSIAFTKMTLCFYTILFIDAIVSSYPTKVLDVQTGGSVNTFLFLILSVYHYLIQ